MIYVMGLPTFQANPLPDCMCATTLSSIHVVKCRRESPILRGHSKKIYPWLKRNISIREICWSATSDREGTEDLSHRNRSLEKCIQTVYKEKKKKYLEVCLRQCNNLPTFVIYLDGLLDVDLDATLKLIAIHLAVKWKRPTIGREAT